MRVIHSTSLLLLACSMVACRQEHLPQEEIVVQETYLHRYGVEVPASDWRERGEDGHVISTLRNGVIVDKSYANGILHGDTTYTFPHNSIIEKVETYHQNRLERDQFFYPSGAPKLQTKYNEDGSTSVTYWYEMGTPKGVEEYDTSGLLVQAQYFDLRHNSDSQVNNYEGTRLVRDPYGQIISKDDIKGGMLNLRTTFYPNGSPKEITSYRNGKVSGVKKTYQPGGEPNTIEEWADGQQTGVTTLFQNGVRYAEVTLKDGVKHGTERRYRDGVTLVEEISWEDQVKHGPCVNYMGGTAQTDWYFKGQPTSQANFEVLNNSVFNRQN